MFSSPQFHLLLPEHHCSCLMGKCSFPMIITSAIPCLGIYVGTGSVEASNACRGPGPMVLLPFSFRDVTEALIFFGVRKTLLEHPPLTLISFRNCFLFIHQPIFHHVLDLFWSSSIYYVPQSKLISEIKLLPLRPVLTRVIRWSTFWES